MPFKDRDNQHQNDQKWKHEHRKKESRRKSRDEIVDAIEISETKRRDRWSRYRERHRSSDEFVVANVPKSDDDDANNNNNNENHKDAVNESMVSMPLRNITNQTVASKPTR